MEGLVGKTWGVDMVEDGLNGSSFSDVIEKINGIYCGLIALTIARHSRKVANHATNPTPRSLSYRNQKKTFINLLWNHFASLLELQLLP